MALDSRQQKVLSKVMKLLQMTVENGCTAAEAESAKLKAEQMMAEYSLSRENISLSDMVTDEFYPSDENGVGYAKAPQWIKTLIASVNRYFGCVVIWGRDSDGDLLAYQSGRKSDMEVADYCFLVIRDQVFELTAEYVKSESIRKNSRQAMSFMESLVYTVANNLEKLLGGAKTVVPSNSGNLSLTLLEKGLMNYEEAKAWYVKESGAVISRRSARLRSNDAGVAAASGISVSRAMSGSGSSQARLGR